MVSFGAVPSAPYILLYILYVCVGVAVVKVITIASILCILSLLFEKWLRPKRPLRLSVYFGVPGAGKTTFAAYLVRQAQRESCIIKFCRVHSGRLCRWILASGLFKRAYPVWSNVEIRGAYRIEPKADLGVYQIEDGSLIIDEAGIEFNNRQYKSLPVEVIRWLKLHRHYRMSVEVAPHAGA